MADADLVLLLVSRALLASKYVGETEIAAAARPRGQAQRSKLADAPVLEGWK